MDAGDILDKFDLIDRAQGWLWAITSWLPRRKSRKGRKVGKLRLDGGVREIRIDRMKNTGGEAERVLEKAHIPIAGRRITSKEAIFLVRARQAAWAELNLMRAGIQLGPGHRLIDQRNVGYAAGKDTVPLWGSAPREAFPQSIAADDCPARASATKPRRNPQPQRRRTLRERIADWL